MLDEGRLTDAKGRLVDFSHTFIILTSNLGSRHLMAHQQKQSAQGPGAGSPEGSSVPPPVREAVIGEARRHFPPEFLNRLDDLLVFAPLHRASLALVAARAVSDLGERASAEHDVAVNITTAAADAIVEMNADAVTNYGARPLRRFVDQTLGTELAKVILRGGAERGSTIHIDAAPGSDGGLSMAIIPAPVEAPGAPARPQDEDVEEDQDGTSRGSSSSSDATSPPPAATMPRETRRVEL